jgi:aspartyl-tRNA(Asn)/glutamyl-tRNA(Gln) amidotransferase subunit A
MSDKLYQLSALELARRVRAGEVSSEAVVSSFLYRARATNGTLNSFVRLNEEGALATARGVDAKVRSGATLGLLAGVPVAVKDMISTRGIETNCGSRILQGYVPRFDAHVVQRILEEDGIVLGKTNMDEFAMGSSNEFSAYGRCGNPWKRDHVPGGSSGGSAASVSARQAPLSLGTDTGGSIRQPASLCGIVGIKPTYGRVSRFGVVAFASSLDQCGPMGGDVHDAALLLSVIAGRDPRDSTSAEVPVERFHEELSGDLRGVRIGIPREYFGEGLSSSIHPDVLRITRDAIHRLSSAGAVVKEVSLPHTNYAISTYYVVAVAEASSNLARYDGVRYGPRPGKAGDLDLESFYVRARSAGFGREVKRRIMLGTFALSSGYYDQYYNKAMKVRTLIREDFRRVFQEVDLLASPTSPIPGFRFGEFVDDPLTMYLMDVLTVPVNLAGLAAISLPAGVTPAGLPVGLQLIAPPFHERKMIDAAYGFEGVAGVSPLVPPEEEIAHCQAVRG